MESIGNFKKCIGEDFGIFASSTSVGLEDLLSSPSHSLPSTLRSHLLSFSWLPITPSDISFPPKNQIIFVNVSCQMRLPIADPLSTLLLVNICTHQNCFRMIFDEGASPPKPFSKTLLSVAPHGILTLGWSYCISSRSFYDCEVKWLVAPAMMQLPFVSDVMQ